MKAFGKFVVLCVAGITNPPFWVKKVRSDIALTRAQFALFLTTTSLFVTSMMLIGVTAPCTSDGAEPVAAFIGQLISTAFGDGAPDAESGVCTSSTLSGTLRSPLRFFSRSSSSAGTELRRGG